MRTVLDQNTLAFEAGYDAFGNGISSNENPYPSGSLRQSWTDGWEYARLCKGDCDG